MSFIARWHMPSNCGWNGVAFEALVCHDNGRIEFSAEVTGKYWYRPTTNVDSSELVDDFRIALSSVLIPVEACKELLSRFDNWLTDRSSFACILASAPDQKLDIEIGPREGLTTTIDHPALTLCYEAPRIRFEIFFIVDPSCVDLARNELEQVLATIASS